MNYGEKYPRCADCPVIADIQAVRDQTASELEEVSLDNFLEDTEVDFLIEKTNEWFTNEINHMLEAGALETDESVMKLRREWGLRLSAAQRDYELIRQAETHVEESSDSLLAQIDENAAYVIERCDGYCGDDCLTRAKLVNIPGIGPRPESTD